MFKSDINDAMKLRIKINNPTTKQTNKIYRRKGSITCIYFP